MNLGGPLDAEKLAEAVLLHVFNMEFPASLLRRCKIQIYQSKTGESVRQMLTLRVCYSLLGVLLKFYYEECKN